MVSFNDFDLAGKDLFCRGLVSFASGNMSIREGDNIYITKKGAALNHLKEDDIIMVPLDGTSENEALASADLAIHRAIYKETTFSAVLHSHPINGIALSNSIDNKIMPQDSRGQSVLRSIPVVRARGVSSNGRDRSYNDDLVKLLPPIFKSGYFVALVKDHGSFAVGESLLDALEYTTCLETSCNIIVVSKLMTPPPVRKVEHSSPSIHDRRRSAIPPSIGVMDRQTPYKRGMGR
jgi:L-fuculose-phosphate aldolase